MTPSGLVESVVQRRLTMIDRLVGAAESRRGITGEELDRDFDTRLIVERILTQLADLAVDINAHITSSLGETAGGEARSTFGKMAQLGIIPRALATELKLSVGLRNVLVHEYVNIDLNRVAESVPQAIDSYTQYRRQIARWLLERR